MRAKIVVISSHFLSPFIEKAVARLKPDCDLVLTTYDNFKHIPSVYDAYAEEADGFLVSGRMAKSAIKAVPHTITRPIVSFQVDLEGLYKTILDIIIDNKEQKLDRILMDFMVFIHENDSAEDFMKRIKSKEFISKLNNRIEHTSAKEMLQVENEMVEHIVQAYEEHTVDMVICQFTNIIPMLEEHHIPYTYPFPSDLTLSSLFRELYVKIEMNHLLANRSTVVHISPRSSECITPENMELLHSSIEAFLRENLIESMIQKQEDGYILFTTAQVLDSITDHYRSCQLNGYLESTLPFECSVGYGIGTTLNDALVNSEHAAREARFAGHSFIKNENGDLIGPLGSEKRIVIENTSSQNVIRIAKQCKLSTITIQKLISYQKLAGTNKVTTQDLASRFGVTIRNANRILQNLEKGKCARIAYTKTTNSKGRPVKVYELNFKPTS